MAATMAGSRLPPEDDAFIEEVGEAAAIGDARDRDEDEKIIKAWILEGRTPHHRNILAKRHTRINIAILRCIGIPTSLNGE